MTASSVTLLRPKKRPDAPFAKLSKVFTEPDLPLKANERLVALVMFQHINMTTMQCWPSVDTIARRAKVNKHTVTRTVKKLEEIGLLKVTKKRTKGKFDRNVYEFSAVKFMDNRGPR